jgi:uroporphyrinogen decarboxylase
MRGSLGDVNMYMALVDDPDWIHDFCRVYTDLALQAWKLYLEDGCIPDGVLLAEDMGYKDRLFCNPSTLEELIFPYYKEVIDFLHGYDLPVILHSCGYQAPMIPLAIEAGFDALNPMEAKAGNDIFEYAEKYGDKLVFVGGLDGRILESGDRDLIRREVTGLVQGMRERGARFVYGSDHSLSTRIDYDDFLYSLEVYREVRGEGRS